MQIQTEDLLKQSAQEIRRLRRENELQAAKIEGFETAALMVRARVDYGDGYGVCSEDILYTIDKHLEELKEEPKFQFQPKS